MNNLFRRIRRAVTACLVTLTAVCLSIGAPLVARAEELSVSAYSWHFLLTADADGSNVKVRTALLLVIFAIILVVLLSSFLYNKMTDSIERKNTKNAPIKGNIQDRLPKFIEKSKDGEAHRETNAKERVEQGGKESNIARNNVYLGSRRDTDTLNRKITALELNRRYLIEENAKLTLTLESLQKAELERAKEHAAIVKSYDSQLKDVTANMQKRIAELEEKLKERESVVDAIEMIKKAIIPYAEKMLLNIHLSEDANANDVFVQTMKNDLEQLLLQSMRIGGIKILYSEAREQGRHFDINSAEIEIRATDDPRLDGTLYRTLRPGLTYNGKCLIYEKVEIFRYRETV